MVILWLPVQIRLFRVTDKFHYWVKNDVPILEWASIAEIHNKLVFNSKIHD